MSIRPLTHAAPHARPRRAEPPQSRVDRNRVARQADRPFLDPSAPSRWSRWSRLSRAGPEGAAGGAREVIESAEARHASGAFLPLHLSGVSSWVASRDHRDFQDDRDGPVAQAAPESIRPLTHAAPLAHGLARARQRSLALRRKKIFSRPRTPVSGLAELLREHVVRGLVVEDAARHPLQGCAEVAQDPSPDARLLHPARLLEARLRRRRTRHRRFAGQLPKKLRCTFAQMLRCRGRSRPRQRF